MSCTIINYSSHKSEEISSSWSIYNLRELVCGIQFYNIISFLIFKLKELKSSWQVLSSVSNRKIPHFGLYTNKSKLCFFHLDKNSFLTILNSYLIGDTKVEKCLKNDGKLAKAIC